jgi:hypothetical protein
MLQQRERMINCSDVRTVCDYKTGRRRDSGQPKKI